MLASEGGEVRWIASPSIWVSLHAISASALGREEEGERRRDAPVGVHPVLEHLCLGLMVPSTLHPAQLLSLDRKSVV